MATAAGILIYTGILLFVAGEFDRGPERIDNSVRLECHFDNYNHRSE